MHSSPIRVCLVEDSSLVRLRLACMVRDVRADGRVPLRGLDVQKAEMIGFGNVQSLHLAPRVSVRPAYPHDLVDGVDLRGWDYLLKSTSFDGLFIAASVPK